MSGLWRCAHCQGCPLLHRHVGHFRDHPYRGQGVAFMQTQIGTQVQGAFVHFDTGIQPVGLLVQAVDFELEHLVLGGRTNLVTPLCETVKRVGMSEILARRGIVALCHGQREELVHSPCGYQLHRLQIRPLRLLVAHRFDTPPPLQVVVPEKRLAVADVDRHALP